jgi:hypothetical protein
MIKIWISQQFANTNYYLQSVETGKSW